MKLKKTINKKNTDNKNRRKKTLDVCVVTNAAFNFDTMSKRT